MIREYVIKVDEDKKDIMGDCPLVEKPKELVRCKDCKKYEADKYNHGFGDCFGPCDSLPGVEENFFCADGEPKDE